MGTWGTGPFDNDDAADWLGKLQDADPHHRVQVISETLRKVVAERAYLEVADAHEAIAAAAVLASRSAGGSTSPSLEPDLVPVAEAITVDDDLASLAVRALDRVTSGESEWRELWEESADPHEAFASVTSLRASLAR